ncbi:MAG: class I SAM-dependent methyltransferase [Lamprobacter sp.]|uniref:class I SAM-dependent methyltransferase n=1 Tax=Lamprobacter sp. TaxID=3100796 RepID=UPI002B25CE57|nr:class I SAM-dependent methyltransferase [Lamprobacter sp.]MEA3642608.1 class I SAM-dependent methyltransferase [Lamprobacter sp.]
MDWAVRIKGFKAPQTSKFRYLELGCGQGFGLNLIAALYPDSDFVGVDFNPQHIAHARDLAAAAGLTNVRFEEADFMALSRNWPYGQFHFVVLHGIYSWVSETLRGAICSCLDQALLSGALAYVSYNAMPGWISALPLQKLLQRHQIARGLSPLPAIDQGFAFMDQLSSSGAALFNALPQLAKRMEETVKKDKSYLIQEYLHENWHPLWFSQVCAEMERAKLSFAGSATLPENYLPTLLPEQMRALVMAYDDPTFSQELIDCLINQAFRRDLFQRGLYKPWTANQNQGLLQSRFVLIKPPKDYQFKTTFGEVNAKPEIYQPIIDALADGPKSVAELGQTPTSTIQALTLLLHNGSVGIEAPQAETRKALAFNQVVARAAAQGAPYTELASANTACGIAAGTPSLMLLNALAEHTPATPEAMGQALAKQLSAIGRQLVKDGQPLTEPAQVQAEAVKQAQEFLETTLPLYKRLGVWE